MTYISAYNRTTSVYTPLDVGGEYLRFSTNNGAERMRLDSSGNLGIGTSSPKLNTNAGTFLTVSNTTSDQAGWLELQGAPASTGSGSGFISFNNSNKAGADKRIAQISGFRGSAADSGAIGFATWNAGVGAEVMRLDAPGNLGLGVNPSAWGVGAGFLAFQLPAGNINSFGTTFLITAQNAFSNSGGSRIYVNDGFASEYIQTSGEHRWRTAPSGTAGDAISFTQAMTLDASGNLMVGTTSPAGGASKFNVYGSQNYDSVNATIANWYSGGTAIGYIGQGNYAVSGASATGISFASQSSMSFATGGQTERARIDSSGNFAVNDTNPSAYNAQLLSVSTSASKFAGVFYGNAASNDGQAALQVAKSSSTNTSAQVLVEFYINAFNTASGRIVANGASAAAFAAFSDARLKENIVDLPPQLENICSLRPVEFDYKDGAGHQIGFIAQEVKEIYPDVIAESDGGMLTLTGWSKTEARLVKAIQEQQAIINSLKARLDAANL